MSASAIPIDNKSSDDKTQYLMWYVEYTPSYCVLCNGTKFEPLHTINNSYDHQYINIESFYCARFLSFGVDNNWSK